MRKALLFLNLLCVVLPIMAQESIGIGRINQVNSEGKREGLWIEIVHSYEHFDCYHNGIKDGLSYVLYSSTKNPAVVGKYSNGEYVGTWYYFSEDGKLQFSLTDITSNTTYSSSIYGYTGIPNRKGYMITYYPNGNKKSEGIWVFNKEDGPELDTASESGEWRFYNEDGTFKNIKKYKVE